MGDGRGPGDERGTGGAGGTGGTDVPGSTGDGGDVVAKVLGQWRRVLPDLDTGPVAVVGRLTRCAALLRQASDAPLAREGFSRPEFDILSALRREDRELTPGQLAREIYASATSVAKRVRTLEEKGLLARRPDDRDRRVVHLSLTVSGRELVDRIMPEQTAYERSLLAGLGEEERDQLARVLGELLRLLEERERGSREGARRGR
ncbi:MarR family transcriptional regulator [Streptomyces albus]|uniref:MarR family transcriptional regulator n=1 Tax=Streptomyces albus TaxID=1888 RepID=A0A6C1CD51_9ACTN|nr:MarR family transcriptional regulator [Streptomyces albus]TGG82013.1 MarR family transcriptional regulator [Streptomyces albus]